MNEQQELQLLKRLESGNLSDKAELQILKALEEKPDDISDLLTATAFQGYKPGQSLEDIVKEKEEKDQDADFDYETGVVVDLELCCLLEKHKAIRKLY